MKTQEKLIKQSRFTKYATFAVYLFTGIVAIGGMVYSYNAIADYANIVHYGLGWQSIFYPLFTEGLMITLGLMTLVVTHNKWPKVKVFKWGSYFVAAIVIGFNILHVDIVHNYNKWTGGWEVVLVIAIPVVVYLGLIEVSQYIIAQTLKDIVKVVKPEYKNEEILEDSISNLQDSKQNSMEKAREAKSEKVAEVQFLVKSVICQALARNIIFTQESLANVVNLSRPTIIGYYRDLIAEGVLVKIARGEYKLKKLDSEYTEIDVTDYLNELERS